MYNLAVCFEDGVGVEKDPVQAVDWYRQAADGGDCDSIYGLALSKLYGQGIEHDCFGAFELLNKLC